MTRYSFLDDFDLFVKHIKTLSYDKLPGLQAHLKMAPSMRKEEISTLGMGASPTKSAVLFLFYPMKDGGVGTVFIQRPIYKGVHSGQISFPGGRYELSDPDLQYTALRETKEEIGIQPGEVEVIGKLSDLFIPPSNYVVSPFLGLMYRQPEFLPDPCEVAKIVEIELSAFFLVQNCRSKTVSVSTGFSFETPCFSINGFTIWGATAMMISEFLEWIKMSE